MSAASWLPNRRRDGFTLIEVIGALVIFSVGVLMVIQVSGALGKQMAYAGTSSHLSVLAAERLDSLEALPYASIGTGTTQDTVVVEGAQYRRTVVLTTLSPLLTQIDVSLTPLDGTGPSVVRTSYVSGAW